MKNHGKYRWRRFWRERLPNWLGWIFPKGKKDCGNHKLYIAQRSPGGSTKVARCYYCTYEETSVAGHTTKRSRVHA